MGVGSRSAASSIGEHSDVELARGERAIDPSTYAGPRRRERVERRFAPTRRAHERSRRVDDAARTESGRWLADGDDPRSRRRASTMRARVRRAADDAARSTLSAESTHVCRDDARRPSRCVDRRSVLLTIDARSRASPRASAHSANAMPPRPRHRDGRAPDDGFGTERCARPRRRSSLAEDSALGCDSSRRGARRRSRPDVVRASIAARPSRQSPASRRSQTCSSSISAAARRGARRSRRRESISHVGRVSTAERSTALADASAASTSNSPGRVERPATSSRCRRLLLRTEQRLRGLEVLGPHEYLARAAELHARLRRPVVAHDVSRPEQPADHLGLRLRRDDGEDASSRSRPSSRASPSDRVGSGRRERRRPGGDRR